MPGNLSAMPGSADPLTNQIELYRQKRTPPDAHDQIVAHSENLIHEFVWVEAPALSLRPPRSQSLNLCAADNV